jgi:hypothetical protein
MLEHIAWISLVIAFTCALIIAIDEFRHPQKMWIMNIVWPPKRHSTSAFSDCGDISEPDEK